MNAGFVMRLCSADCGREGVLKRLRLRLGAIWRNRGGKCDRERRNSDRATRLLGLLSILTSWAAASGE